MKYLSHIALMLTLLLSGCTKVEDIPSESGEGNIIMVPFSISAADYECDEATKGLAPYIPDVENLIYDIWVVQYSSRGVLLPNSTFHYRTTQPGALVVGGIQYAGSTSQGFALTESSDPCTVCFIANMGDNVPEWPDNIYSFQEIMMPVLSSDASQQLTRTPMCGYYHGPITHGAGVNVSLGRMITRLNVVINNQTGKNITDLVVSITNAPRYAHIFPHTDQIPFNESEREATRSQRDAGISLAAGQTKNLYYYIAPNLYGSAWPTTLWTTCMLDGVKMQGAMILGDSVPDPSEQNVYPPVADSDRDLRLYPNNQYTFTINYVDNQ